MGFYVIHSPVKVLQKGYQLLGGVMLLYHLCYAIGTYKTGVRLFFIFYLFIMFFILTYHFNFRTCVCTFFIMFDTVNIFIILSLCPQFYQSS